MGSVCPHCRRNRPSTLERAWSTGSHYLWLILSITLVTGLELFQQRKSEIGFAIIWAAFAIGWALAKDWGHRRDLLPAINVPPTTPREFQSLLTLMRPRDVCLPFRAKMGVIAEAALLSALAIAFYLSPLKRYFPFAGRYIFHGYDLIPMAFLVLCVGARVPSVRQELLARDLLSDGNITMGVITDWHSSHQGAIKISYQFWTATGECFKHRGTVVSDKKSFAEGSAVPVFYLLEDPAKSVALCCARSRVRVPEGRDLLQTKGSLLRP